MITLYPDAFSFESNDIDALNREERVTFQIKLIGVIGSSIKFQSTEVFSLTLINPCYNSTYVNIVAIEPNMIDDYSIFEPKREV